MKNHAYPNIGHWYQDGSRVTMFKIVAIDKDGDIAIQYFDGAIEALDLDSWYSLELEEIPPPEDWSGAYEIAKEDIDLSDENLEYDSPNPLDEIELDEGKL